MLVAIHSPTVYQRPVGCWWFDPADEVMRSYYLPGNEDYQILGAETMGSVVSAPQWEYWAQRMADRTPNLDSWEVSQLSDTTPPEEFLKMLGRARVAA